MQLFADEGLKTEKQAIWAQSLGAARAKAAGAGAKIPLEIVKKSATAACFKVLPKRWIVERTFGWRGRCRRLAKDYESLARSQSAFVILAMISVMLRRLARARKSSKVAGQNLKKLYLEVFIARMLTEECKYCVECDDL